MKKQTKVVKLNESQLRQIIIESADPGPNELGQAASLELARVIEMSRQDIAQGIFDRLIDSQEVILPWRLEDVDVFADRAAAAAVQAMVDDPDRMDALSQAIASAIRKLMA